MPKKNEYLIHYKVERMECAKTHDSTKNVKRHLELMNVDNIELTEGISAKIVVDNKRRLLEKKGFKLILIDIKKL